MTRRSAGMVIVVLLIAGCVTGKSRSDSPPHILRLKGSDTMLMLGLGWAEEFMSDHPDVSVYVEGGGTSVGVASMIRGEVDWAMASRPLTPEELNQLAQGYQSLGYGILVARDALSFYVNEANPVTELTTQQLRGIFNGEIRNWQDVGGDDAPIVVLRRNSNSGTHLFLEERVLRGDTFYEAAVTSQTTVAMVRTIADDPYAIGYGGLAYAEGVKGLSVDWVAPNPEYVRGGTYPVSRYLYLYSVAPPSGISRIFADWILSGRGQGVVEAVGYVPLYDLQSSPTDPLPR